MTVTDNGYHVDALWLTCSKQLLHELFFQSLDYDEDDSFHAAYEIDATYIKELLTLPDHPSSPPNLVGFAFSDL